MQPLCQPPPVPGSFDYAVDVDHSPLLTEEEVDDDRNHEWARFNWTVLIERTFRPLRPILSKNLEKSQKV